MAGTAVDAARDEITAQLELFAPELEGLQDYARLNLHPDTAEEVQAFIVMYQRRIGHLIACRDTIDVLLLDGHPGLPVREVSPQELADLQENLDTITAARARFASNVAIGMTLAAGETEPK